MSGHLLTKQAKQASTGEQQLSYPSEMQEEDLENLEVSENSFIEFYKNGVKQPYSFYDIWEADYFAAISLYMNARVAVNFGQTGEFKHLKDILKNRHNSEIYDKKNYEKIKKYDDFIRRKI